jgi:non-specific serine/threonine protein kinase
MGEAGQSGAADALENLAEVDAEEGQYAAARPRFEQALAINRDLGRILRVSHTLTMLGSLAMRTGNYEEAATRLEQAVAHCRALDDPSLIAQALAACGELAVRRGQYPRAVTLLQESLDIRRKLGEAWGTAITLGSLGWVALRQRNFSRMRELLGESLSMRLEIGDASGSAWCLERLAEAAMLEVEAAAAARRRDNFKHAARMFGTAATVRARLNAAMDEVDQPAHEGHLAALRASLGADDFSAEWAAGAAMPLVQAVDEALTEPTGSPAKESLGGLTVRERQVAALIAQGLSNRKIAETMVVSVKTIETYVTRILSKLDFDSRVQIATWAVENGLSSPGKD